MTPLRTLTLQAGVSTFTTQPEMSMGLQYFDGNIYLLENHTSVPAKALVLSSSYVVVVADDAFLKAYQGVVGHPFLNSSKGTCEFACVFPASPGVPPLLVWDDNAPATSAEAGPTPSTLATSAIQNAGLIAALNLTAAPASGTPSPPGPPTSVPPPGSARTTQTTSLGMEGFLRFTFNTPDPRVNTSSGTVAPGTYCTPYRDGQKVTSGYEAVGRYALPVPLPYKHTLLLVPPAGTQVEIGTVVSAFGQGGGGVEAYFPNGFTNPAMHYHALPPY